MKHYLFLASLFALAACTNEPATPGNAPQTNADTPAIARQSPAAGPQTYRGLIVLGNEVSTFRDCATGKTWWLNDQTNGLHAVYDSVVQPAPIPYEAVYAVVQGIVGPRDTLGYASEYEGTLDVVRVDTLRGKSRFNYCFPYEFWLTGTEPFWSLQISQAENGLFFKDIGHEQGHSFPYVKPTVSGNIWTYDARTEAGQTLRVTIKKEQCSDGMSDLVYSYSAEVQFGKTKYRGCAVRYGEAMPAER